MFINDRLIYLQMQKTGCTHIARLLAETVGGEQHGKHSKLTFDPGDRVVIGSVRNPWDWYVSLWAFGCSGEGSVFDKTTRPARTLKALARSVAPALPHPGRTVRSVREWRGMRERDYEKWRRLYGDPNDVRLFRQWIRHLLSDAGKADLIEGYPQSGLSRFAGFMTYRFASMYSKLGAWTETGVHIDNADDLGAFWDAHAILDRIIFMESLEEDVAFILSDLGYDGASVAAASQDRTNASAHRDFAEYYDSETAQLVREQETFIIDRYGYRGPNEAQAAATSRASEA